MIKSNLSKIAKLTSLSASYLALNIMLTLYNN